MLDEGHIIKNPKTQRSKSISDIPCVHRIIISGTPIQNNLKVIIYALFLPQVHLLLKSSSQFLFGMKELLIVKFVFD